MRAGKIIILDGKQFRYLHAKCTAAVGPSIAIRDLRAYFQCADSHGDLGRYLALMTGYDLQSSSRQDFILGTEGWSGFWYRISATVLGRLVYPPRVRRRDFRQPESIGRHEEWTESHFHFHITVVCATVRANSYWQWQLRKS